MDQLLDAKKDIPDNQSDASSQRWKWGSQSGGDFWSAKKKKVSRRIKREARPQASPSGRKSTSSEDPSQTSSLRGSEMNFKSFEEEDPSISIPVPLPVPQLASPSLNCDDIGQLASNFLQTDECFGALEDNTRSSVVSSSPPCNEFFNEDTSSNVLFLPENMVITILEIIHQVLICGEFILVTTVATLGKWYDPPTGWEILFCSMCSLSSLLFILSRLHVARLKDFQVYDDDVELVRLWYYKSWFPFDVLTGFPLDLLLFTFSRNAVIFRSIQCIRGLKIVRSPSLFLSTNPLAEPRRFEMFSALLFIVVGHHIIAVLYMLVRSDKHSETLTSSFYYEALYWAVQTTSSVGFGDLTYDDNVFRIFSTIIMLVGSGAYAWFVGNVSVYFMAKDVIAKKQKETRAIVLQLLNRYRVPFGLQKEAFAIYPLIFGDSCMQYTEILQAFPPYLQEKIALAMKFSLIIRVPMFHGSEAPILRELAAKLSRHIVEPNKIIIEMGETGQEMFFLSVGTVEIYVPNENGEGHNTVVLLRDGSWFGEIAILRDTVRTAAAKTVTVCELYMLTKQDFTSISKKHPDSNFKRAIQSEIDNRMKALDYRAMTSTSDKKDCPTGRVSPCHSYSKRRNHSAFLNTSNDGCIILDKALEEGTATTIKSNVFHNVAALKPPENEKKEISFRLETTKCKSFRTNSTNPVVMKGN